MIGLKLKPPTETFVPQDERDDVIGRAFPKETLEKQFGIKKYIVELYYRKGDEFTKNEINKILESARVQ